MEKFAEQLILISIIFLLVGCAGSQRTAEEPQGMPAVSELESGWNQLDPEGNTICATGTPFSFFVRSADPTKLLLYFDGDGACWDQVTCNPRGIGTSYTPFVNENDTPKPIGIFDFDNQANPFADYSTIVVPSCTGDLHLGNSAADFFMDDDSIFIVDYSGFNNSMATLNWMFENFDAPETIFVAGSDAGAISSPFYTTFVAEQYPNARIAQFGEGGGAYRSAMAAYLYPFWGTKSVLTKMPQVDEVGDVLQGVTFNELYIAAAQLYPNITFSQLNMAADATQLSFSKLVHTTSTDDEETLLANIQANYADIAAADANNFVGFIGPGEFHTVLDSNRFYDLSVDTVSLRDWVNDIAMGKEVGNVQCSDCDLKLGE